MNRRTERVASLIRDTLGQLILAKLSDPRIDPATTSITRVEVPEDLLTARVYISVMGTETAQRLAVQALQHASGHIQELMMRKISLRNTPLLQFVEDKNFKKTLETYQLLQKVSQELRQKEEEAAKQEPAGGTPEAQDSSPVEPPAPNPESGKEGNA